MSKIIKCMFFVLLAAVLPLSVHAQQVTLHLQDVTVRKAFRELEVKGNVSLVYEKNDVDLTRKVTVKVDNQPISKALDQILKGQELIYKIKDNHIIITRPVVQKSDKKRRINGVISDVNDELLIGVSVSIPGTNIGTVSNMEGKFELEIPEDAKKLQVSYIGFDTQEISLSPGKTTFNIVMGENVKMLSEVVVVGYGTQKKVNLTGSVATVNLEKESLSRPLVSASQALSGMTAGLQVMQSSGTPYNEGFSFNIRGVGTLNSSSPLVLVDGMEQSLNDIKAQLAKDEVTLTESQNNVNLALLDLAQSLELERSDRSFDIQTPVIEDAVADNMSSILPPENIYDHAVTFKPQIKEQQYLLESQKKMLRVAQAGYYPKLNFGASYSNGYYHSTSGGEFADTRSFSEQFKQNGQKIVGFSLSIPLFNRFQVRNSVRTARINIINRELLMENTKKTLYKEIQQAYYNATASQEKYTASASQAS